MFLQKSTYTSCIYHLYIHRTSHLPAKTHQIQIIAKGNKLSFLLRSGGKLLVYHHPILSTTISQTCNFTLNFLLIADLPSLVYFGLPNLKSLRNGSKLFAESFLCFQCKNDMSCLFIGLPDSWLALSSWSAQSEIPRVLCISILRLLLVIVRAAAQMFSVEKLSFQIFSQIMNIRVRCLISVFEIQFLENWIYMRCYGTLLSKNFLKTENVWTKQFSPKIILMLKKLHLDDNLDKNSL